MTNSISIYNFNQNKIRTQTINGEPYFCLKDCALALGIKDCTDRLFEKGAENISTLTNGGIQKITFINEPNLYRLVFRSRKPQAQAFADWVYSEVLPSIRKTGAYVAPSSEVSVPYSITADKDAMKAIGGIVKRCCASAVKETLATDNPNLANAVAHLIEYIVEERAEKKLAEWKSETAQRVSIALNGGALCRQ